MNSIYLSSTSPIKLGHYRRYFSSFDTNVKSLELEIPELQIIDCSKVALAKLAMAKTLTPQRPLLVDDVGLEIQGLKGFPGAFLKPVLEQGGVRLLRDLCVSTTQNKRVNAILVCAIAYSNGGKDFCVTGTMPGLIDFSNDSYLDDTQTIRCFFPEGSLLSIAELQNSQPESAYRHRFEAMKQVHLF